jgi:hypothetical protein
MSGGLRSRVSLSRFPNIRPSEAAWGVRASCPSTPDRKTFVAPSLRFSMRNIKLIMMPGGSVSFAALVKNAVWIGALIEFSKNYKSVPGHLLYVAYPKHGQQDHYRAWPTCLVLGPRAKQIGRGWSDWRLGAHALGKHRWQKPLGVLLLRG